MGSVPPPKFAASRATLLVVVKKSKQKRVEIDGKRVNKPNGASTAYQQQASGTVAEMAEVHSNGIRPANGSPTRLGRVEEVVSLVSTVTEGWGRNTYRPGNMRVDTFERV